MSEVEKLFQAAYRQGFAESALLAERNYNRILTGRDVLEYPTICMGPDANPTECSRQIAALMEATKR